LTLFAALTSYPTVTASINFSVTITSYTCTSSTVYTPSVAFSGSYSYTIGAAALTITAPTYTTTPFTCAETVEYLVEKQDATTKPDYVTWENSNKIVSISTTDTTLVGPIYLRIKITRSESLLTQNLDFTLTLVNPCSTATISTSALTITPITVTVGTTSTSSSYTMSDSAKDNNANISCGNRTFSVWDSTGTTAITWITITGTTSFTITAAPNSDSLYNANAQNFVLRTVLTSFPTRTGDKTF